MGTNRVRLFAMKLLFGFIAISLAGCVPETKTDKTEVEAPKEQSSNDRSGPEICIGMCYGPRINLNTGELEVGPSISMSPSLLLY